MSHKKILILAKDAASKSYKPTSCPCSFHILFSLLIDVSGPHNFANWISPKNQYVFACRTPLTQLVKDDRNVTIYSLIDLDEFVPGGQSQTLVLSHADFMDLMTAWGNALQQEPETIFLISQEDGSVQILTQLDTTTKYLQLACDCASKQAARKDEQGNFIVTPRLQQRLQELQSDAQQGEFKINQTTFFPSDWSAQTSYDKIAQVLQTPQTEVVIKDRFGIIIRRALFAKIDDATDSIDTGIILDAQWNVVKAYPLRPCPSTAKATV